MPLHRVPIPEAARVLGVSIPTVKRRLKRGELAGVQEPTASGFKWLVLLPLGEGAESPPGESPGSPGPESPAASRESPVSPLVTQRAQEMAAYTRQLLEPLHRRLEELAGENGRLKLELEQARAELELSRRRDNGAAPGEDSTARRPWWRWWG